MSAAIPHLREAARLLQRREFEAARAACTEALALEPGNADGWNLLGLTEYHAGDGAAALAALERAVAAKPGYGNAWQNLAAVRAAQGDARGAVRAEQQALALDPRSSADAWYNLGVRAWRAGLHRPARAAFEQALAREPQHLDALNNLALALHAEHEYVAARAVAERLLAAAPAAAGAQHAFAAVFSRATEPKDLVRGLEQAMMLLAQAPAHTGGHDCAAIILGKLGQREAALEHARRAVALEPAAPDYAFTLGRLLEEDGRLDEADAVLAAARSLAPNDARLACEHGSVTLRRGDPRAAADLFEATLALAPDDQSAIAQRLLALQLSGQEDSARKLLGFELFVRPVRLEVPEPFPDAASFNRQLAEDIRHHSRLRFEPVGLAAKGGYLTDDLLADQTAAIVGFERSLRRAIDAYIAALEPDPSHPFLRAIPARYRLNLWATRVAAQGMIDTHIHEQSWLSGAYYVELAPVIGAGGDSAGYIEFGRPHRNLPEAPAEDIRLIRPEVGLLILFPSYLYHRSLPFEGEGERISISFDLAPAEEDAAA